MQHLKRDPKKVNWVRKRADNKISLVKTPVDNPSLEKSE
jgi:ribosomal protein L24E